jgi:alkyl hydroperoxide reductase subunit AhpC
MNLGVLRMARRHTFIIDPDGRIAKVYLAVDPASHSRDVIGELRRLMQMPDDHGVTRRPGSGSGPPNSGLPAKEFRQITR